MLSTWFVGEIVPELVHVSGKFIITSLLFCSKTARKTFIAVVLWWTLAQKRCDPETVSIYVDDVVRSEICVELYLDEVRGETSKDLLCCIYVILFG